MTSDFRDMGYGNPRIGYTVLQAVGIDTALTVSSEFEDLYRVGKAFLLEAYFMKTDFSTALWQFGNVHPHAPTCALRE
jgi:hypothetical protein